MRNTITVMNAKGGVGKSTLVLSLAETLAHDHGRKVLVIDADAFKTASGNVEESLRLICEKVHSYGDVGPNR